MAVAVANDLYEALDHVRRLLNSNSNQCCDEFRRRISIPCPRITAQSFNHGAYLFWVEVRHTYGDGIDLVVLVPFRNYGDIDAKNVCCSVVNTGIVVRP
jgi:hypothetical protein